jgi:hypothetical protein
MPVDGDGDGAICGAIGRARSRRQSAAAVPAALAVSQGRRSQECGLADTESDADGVEGDRMRDIGCSEGVNRKSEPATIATKPIAVS